MNSTRSVGRFSNRGFLQALRTQTSLWADELEGSLEASIQANQEDMGHLEERILKQTLSLQCQVLAQAAQQKADQVPPRCPVCGQPLKRLTHGHERTFQTRFGPITLKRTRGRCAKCRAWRFPADHVLGLEERGGYSPGLQELAALLVSQMPVHEASAVLERLTGRALPKANLDRQARREGQRAQEQRQQMDHDPVPQQLELPFSAPFQMVIEIDAWNIRERDNWGQTRALRKRGKEPARWHWVYGATCFRLDHRCRKHKRPIITERGFVMTRLGMEALRQQLWAEAMRRGLGKASRVLVIADGAVWIWSLALDRFPEAIQRLDFFHAAQHLWAVANAVHGEGTPAAQAWIKPLLKQLKNGHVSKVIGSMATLLQQVFLDQEKEKTVQNEVAYFRSHQQRMSYGMAQKQGEPIGSGAIESTCRQYQCRFKRPGQFWSTQGDEGLLCLQTFYRNGRWKELFPHSGSFDPSKN